MAVDGYLKFNTKVDTKGFNRGTKSVSGSLQSLKGELASVGKAAAAAFSVAKLVQFSKQAIDLASDIQEVQNVVDVAFGETSGKMEAFADTAIETYGISKLTAKQTGSTFMAMAAGMGLAKDSASDMAVALTGLSADMASFYNVEQDVASTALKSVFTGETETLKQFGIVMTEANLQAFALQQGITKDISKMTQAEKVTLRYNYVMAQTALAQGDFARTNDSWANQTRMLSEKWKEFSSVVGQALMNTLLPAVRALNSLMSQLIEFANQAYQSLAKVFGWETQSTETVNGTAAAIAASVQNQDDLTEATKETSKAAQDNLQSFDKINKLSGDEDKASSSSALSTPSTGAYNIGGSVSLDTKDAQKELSGFAKKVRDTFAKVKAYIEKNFSGIFKNFWGGLKDEGKELGEIFQNIFSDIEKLAEPLKSYFEGDFTTSLQTTFQTISNIVLGLFDTFNMVFSGIWEAVYPILENFVTVGLPMITQFSTEALSTLGTNFEDIKAVFDMLWKEAAEPALTFISNLWCDLVDTIAEAWNTWGKPIFDGIRDALDNTKEVFVSAWDSFLKPIFDKFMEALQSIWKEHLQPLVAEFLDFVGTLVQGALDIYNQFILPIVKWFVEELGPPLSKVFNGIIEMIKNLVGNVLDAVSGIIESLKGVVNFIVGVFTGDWEKAWQGIKQIFEGIWTALENVLRVPVNAIIGLINGMLDSVEYAVNGMINAVNKMSITVPDWVPNIGGNTYGFNLSNITIPDIPYLAQGTVVPASYGEFLAVLGDNKRETEVVSPLSTMKKALSEVLDGRDGGDINLVVTLDGSVVYKTVVKKNRENTISTGVNALAT